MKCEVQQIQNQLQKEHQIEISHGVDKACAIDRELVSDGMDFVRAHAADKELHKPQSALLSNDELRELRAIGLVDSRAAGIELFAQALSTRYGGCSYPELESLIIKAFPNVWRLISSEGNY